LKADAPELGARFLDVVRRHGAEDRVIAASFRRGPLGRLRAAGYRGDTSLARWEFVAAWLVPRAMYGRPPGTRAQIPTHVGPWPIGTRRVVEKLHALGLGVDYWTINDPDEARRLVALGADGIMTDDPGRIVPAVRAAGG
jgi:glycerophosphoryl diester phosphodiesterase